MIKKKICLIGAVAVGKTSLVQRYVKGIFSDRYLTTIGVKIDKKSVRARGIDIEFIIWDLAGEDEVQGLRLEYLDGSAGYLLVVDGTRPHTFAKALELHGKVRQRLGELPFVLVVNKSDLQSQWFDVQASLREADCRSWSVQIASAKENTGVEEAFRCLAERLAPEGEAADA